MNWGDAVDEVKMSPLLPPPFSASVKVAQTMQRLRSIVWSLFTNAEISAVAA